MLLEDKNAIVYGAGGAIGGAVAREFAREGANLYLTGRSATSLEMAAKELAAFGATVRTAVVDALDPDSVNRHAAEVAGSAGRIDISFNAIGVDHEQGLPLVEMSVEDFSLPVATYTRTHFLTATAAARHMMTARSGVILTLSTSAAGVFQSTSGFGVACAAVERLSLQLAAELGQHGIRVVCLRPDGIPETARLNSHARQLWSRAAQRMGMTLDQMLDAPPDTLVGRNITLDDVANLAAFMASDRAAGMTATVTNLTGGHLIG